MKPFSLLFLLLSLCVSLQAQKTHKHNGKKKNAPAEVQTPAITSEKAEIHFDTTEHNFGYVIEGSEAVYTFVFYNVGKEPLVLTGAQPGCSCTVSDYTHEPVMPGKKGTIVVKYSTKGRIGGFTKSITVTSNAVTNPVNLMIRGTVMAAPQEVH